MKLTRHNLVNVLIALAGILFVGGFVFLATRGDDKNSGDLAAISSTTTAVDRVTTSTFPTTSTTFNFVTTTTALTTATTKKPATTATTKKPTTATTRGSTATTLASGPSGPANERSDNSASFNHGSDGSFSATSTDPPGGADPFRFVIKTAPGSGGVSGETASVKFIVTLTNNTSKTVNFPGGLKIVVTMKTPSGADLIFNMTAADVTNITSGETITLTQERGVSGYGTFEASATCDVDYG
ncbi:MAG: hypothetical protein QOI61_290 [Actinomycetota bacterium]|jgi:hypothetical protein